MNLLAFSDVHLRQGLDHGRTRAERLLDQEQTLARIAAAAIANHVDAVVFGGDMFEGPTVPSSDYVRVRSALVRPLAAAGIPIVGISGNQTHDSAGNEGEHNAMAVLHQPGIFDVYTRDGLHVLPGVAVIACVPWASTARLRAMLGGGQVDNVNDTASGLVIQIMEELRERARAEHPDLPCVGVSHFATTGWRTPTGLPTDEIRDVVLPLGELERVGFDALLIGHIHAPGVINGTLAERGEAHRPSVVTHPSGAVGNPGQAPGIVRPVGQPASLSASAPIISLGSPHCLSFGEEHVDHGCWLLRDNDAPEFVPLGGRRFVTLDYDAAEVEALLDQPGPPATRGWTSTVQDAIVRLRYKADQGDPILREHAAVTAALVAAGAHHVYKIIPLVERETRARVEGISEDIGPLDALALWQASPEGGSVPVDLAYALRDWMGRQLEEWAA